MATMAKEDTVLARLRSALGEAGVQTSAEALDYFSNDVYRGGALPLAVIRPASVEQLQAAVRLCAEANVAMVPRGGGASYTDAYLSEKAGHVLFDTGALDTIEIDEFGAVVTCGAGVTWAALKAALDAKGLRTPFWGPFSGIAATVGGSMSQNSVSHGGTAHGISAQSALSMDVVLASGEILSTSSSRAMRFYGPDLTGLFTGDCGIFGIKARIRLPLLPILPRFECVSFAFDSFADYHAASRKAAMAKLEESHFGLDLALSQGQIGRQDGMGARLKIAADVLKRAPNKLKGVAQLVQMAIAGESAMRAGAYMCHFIIEGFDQEEAAHKARLLRKLLDGLGREIANSIPTFVQSMPFAPLYNVLGPGGERWVPIHGVFPHDQVVPFDTAFKALIASRQAEMDRHGVWLGTMFSPVGSAGFLYEIAAYWPDARTSYHVTTLGEEYLAGQPSFAANPEARAFVDKLKGEMIDLMQSHEAAHFQLGRAYPYQPRLSEQQKALLGAIKAQLDPKGLMNPGALGF